MLKRAAIVIWWFGALVLAAASIGCAYKQAMQLLQKHNCTPVIAEYAEWQKRVNEARAKYRAELEKPHSGKKAATTGDPEIDAAFAEEHAGKEKKGREIDPIDLAFPEKASDNAFDPDAYLDEQLAVEKVAPMRDGLEADHIRCEQSAELIYWFALPGAAVATLICFAVAYIFGGRFWLPPRAT